VVRNPERPLGTHAFTATELKDDGMAMRWWVVPVPARISPRSTSRKVSRASRTNPEPIRRAPPRAGRPPPPPRRARPHRVAAGRLATASRSWWPLGLTLIVSDHGLPTGKCARTAPP
jgi:hypothetical protein